MGLRIRSYLYLIKLHIVYQVISMYFTYSGTATSIHEESHSARRKTPIPLWPEWNDQDLTNEKWVGLLSSLLVLLYLKMILDSL